MPSNPEQIAAAFLAQYGFIPYDRTFPTTFCDKDGVEFTARPDFYNPQVGIYVEVKDRSLNSKTSKTTAVRAMARVEPWRYARNPSRYQCQHQWNHAAAKQGIVQERLSAENFVVLFTGKPDLKTLQLIEKHGLHAYDRKNFKKYLVLAQLIRVCTSEADRSIQPTPQRNLL